MDLKRVEHLLREYASRLRAERLFSEEKAAELRSRLAPTLPGDEDAEAERAPVAAGGTRLPGKRIARRWVIAGGVVLAVAAAVFLAIFLPHGAGGARPALGLTVDAAVAKSDLFHATRGAGPTSETSATQAGPGNLFYVGVRVAQPAYVRLLALDSRGRWEQLPLDRTGSLELPVAAGSETAFGGYERQAADAAGQKSNVEYVVVLASVAPVDAATLTQHLSAVSTPSGEAPRAAAERVAADLGSRFQCETKVVPP